MKSLKTFDDFLYHTSRINQKPIAQFMSCRAIHAEAPEVHVYIYNSWWARWMWFLRLSNSTTPSPSSNAHRHACMDITAAKMVWYGLCLKYMLNVTQKRIHADKHGHHSEQMQFPAQSSCGKARRNHGKFRAAVRTMDRGKPLRMNIYMMLLYDRYCCAVNHRKSSYRLKYDIKLW